MAIQPTLTHAPTAAPAVRPNRLLALVKLMRPRHCLKTLLVVPLPMLYAQWTVAAYGRLAWALAVFIVTSALTYILNDLADLRRDRVHPTKRSRPLASGLVPVAYAWLLAAGLGAVLATLVAVQGLTRSWPALGYLALNMVYSTLLKHLPLIDTFVVAIGFQLRLEQGAIAAGVRLSAWLALSVFALCLLLVLGKRRHELLVSGASHRPALRGYSVRYIEYMLVFTASVATVSFFAYLKTDASLAQYADRAVLASAPFATFAVFQYLRLLIIRGDGGDPVRSLVRDRPMVINALLWAAVLIAVAVASRYPAVPADLLAHVR